MPRTLKDKRDWQRNRMSIDSDYKQRQYNKRTSIGWKQHKEAIQLLGGICVNCGENNILVLQINHLNGGGIKEYDHGKNHRKVYAAIVAGERRTDDLDIRCANCNILYEYEMGRRTNWFKRSDV